jgi:hypothetical protein
MFAWPTGICPLQEDRKAGVALYRVGHFMNCLPSERSTSSSIWSQCLLVLGESFRPL